MPEAPAAVAAGSDIESLVAALVECNDQMVALYELLSVGFSSLDEATSLERILGLGASLLDAELETWIEAGEIDDRLDRPADLSVAPDTAGRPSTAMRETAVVDLGTPDQSLSCRVRATRDDHAFTTGDRKLLGAVSSVALASASISRRHASAVEQAIVQRDYETASELARLAVPPWQTPVPGVDLFASTRPARAAGGDLYQFALIDGVFWFAVGDVTGKGLASALIMAQVVSACGAAFQIGGPVESVVAAIDGMVYDYIESTGRFVTLLVGRYDLASRQLDLVNAGHSPVIRRSAAGQDLIRPVASPVGVFPLTDADSISVTRFDVEPGEYLVVGSDGLTEQTGDGEEMFGLDALLAEMEGSTESASDLGHRLLDRVDRFAAGRPQSDDQTLVVMKFEGSP